MTLVGSVVCFWRASRRRTDAGQHRKAPGAGEHSIRIKLGEAVRPASPGASCFLASDQMERGAHPGPKAPRGSFADTKARRTRQRRVGRSG